MNRVDALTKVVDEVHRVALQHDRVAVGIDGPDAAGKSTLADHLAGRLTSTVIRASVDDFQRPREQRYGRGRRSPQGYYLDAFDYTAVQRELIDPFLSGANRVRTATFDYRSNATIEAEATAPNRCLLIVDGVFLHRRELCAAWTLSLYLHVNDDECVRRAKQRDDAPGGEDEIERLYRERYLPAQLLYREAVKPTQVAHITLDNNDPQHPVILNWHPPEQT